MVSVSVSQFGARVPLCHCHKSAPTPHAPWMDGIIDEMERIRRMDLVGPGGSYMAHAGEAFFSSRVDMPSWSGSQSGMEFFRSGAALPQILQPALSHALIIN